MIKRSFVFTVSLVAMFSVGVARADIAATSYVDAGVNAANTAASNAQTSANNAGTAASNAQTSANNAQAAADAAQASANAAAASAKTANDAVATKFGNTSTVKDAIVTTDADGKVAPVAIVDAGTGAYVTDVTVSAGKVTLTRGTPAAANNATLTIQRNGTSVGTFTANASTDKTIDITVPTGALASKSTITSGDITDYAIGAIDLGTDSVETAKIKDAAVTTAKIADANVTKAKLSADVQASLGKADSAMQSIGAGTVTKTMLDSTVQASLGKADTALQQAAISDMQVKSDIQTSFVANLSEADKNKKYTSVGYVESRIGNINDGLGTVNDTLAEHADLIEAAQGTADAAVVKAQGDANKNKAVITDASGNITTGTIATGMIANGAVTAAKTSGVIGFIPSGSAAADTYAQIWVE